MSFTLIAILFSYNYLIYGETTHSQCATVPVSPGDPRVLASCEGNFTDVKVLKESLENITNRITIFELQNAVLDTLPADMFHDVTEPEVKRIVFKNVTMGLMAVPELGPPPFERIKDHVESLEIHDSFQVFAWNFSSLDMKNLKSLIIENSDMTAVRTPFDAYPQLRFVQFIYSNIHYIHFESFRKNKMLTICSLAYNKIAYITRRLFPEDASHLYSIDISYNNIWSLPSDMFSGMSKLKELKLDNNFLAKPALEAVKPLWNNLSQLWLNGNNIHCESLCWMSDLLNTPLFLGSSNCKLEKEKIFIDVYLKRCEK